MVHGYRKRFSIAAVALFILCSPLVLLENQGMSVTAPEQAFYSLSGDGVELVRLSPDDGGGWAYESVNSITSTNGSLLKIQGLATDHSTSRVLALSQQRSGVQILELDMMTARARSLLTLPGVELQSFAIHPVTGEIAGYSGTQHMLMVIDPMTGMSRRIELQSETTLLDITFEHAPRPVLYAVAADHALYSISLQNGELRRIAVDAKVRGVRALDFIPGVGLVALGEQLYYLDLSSGRVQILSDGLNSGLHELAVVDRRLQRKTRVGYVRSRETEAGNMLEWMTDEEVHNLGFWVVRNDAVTGEYKLVTPRLIYGQGNSSRRRYYTFVDRMAEPDKQYTYFLIDVPFDGPVARYGPVVSEAPFTAAVE